MTQGWPRWKTCRVVTPPSKDACGAPAPYEITFSDGDRVDACQTCALNLQELAKDHHTKLAIKTVAE